jgi:hypothetical protein
MPLLALWVNADAADTTAQQLDTIAQRAQACTPVMEKKGVPPWMVIIRASPVSPPSIYSINS